jgi:tryptophan synthase alpha chain
MSERINKVFSDKKKKLVTFVTGGDPDQNTSQHILEKIILNGADIIEIGMPFSDPMADGPTIQLASNRAIKNGTNLEKIFSIIKKIRIINNKIPIILMGYYNVILHFGITNFVKECSVSGVDGLIIVDLQPEEDSQLFESMKLDNIDLIRLITPTTTEKRLKTITENASGFLYYVTITGVTGQKSADMEELKSSIKKIKSYSTLPIVAGFGINNEIQVNAICKIADGAVVGSSLIKIIEENLGQNEKILNLIGNFVKDLKSGTNL